MVKYGKLLTHSDTKIENVSIANDIEVRAHTYVIATGQTLDTDQMVKLWTTQVRLANCDNMIE